VFDAIAAQILEEVRRHGRLTIGQMLRSDSASRSTVPDHLRTLVTRGHLVCNGTGNGTWCSLP
jgi:DNA-binding IclR family transcriptional regulator